MDFSQRFKDLHRQVRLLELQTHHQLNALSKVKKSNQAFLKYEEQPLLEESDSNDRKSEVESLFSQISAVLDQMSDVAEQSQSAMHLRSAQQMRSTYENDLAEFKKLCQSLTEAEVYVREPVSESNEAAGYSARRPKNDAALRENQSAHSSIHMIDEHISLALETREQLSSQRTRFKSVQTRMNDVFSHFPKVGILMQRIYSRKRFEAIVLGILIGALTIISLAYLFS